MSIQKKDERVERYLQYYLLRRNDEYSKDQVDNKLGFGSSAALYQQLMQDGFPVCPVCGETPAGSNHCKTSRKRKPRPADRKVVKLPPAADAIPLFERVIGYRPDEQDPDRGWAAFASGLHKLCKDLRQLEEELRGKRFVSNKVSRPESDAPDPPFEILRREDFSEVAWVRVCEAFSQPDSIEEFTYYDTPDAPVIKAKALGATSKAPYSGLVVLIGTYLLMGRSVDPLLEALHPDPSLLIWDQPEDEEQRKARKKLEEKIEQLQLIADQVATLVRGGTVGAGSPTEELSKEELELAYEITEIKEQEDLSYDQIYERLRDQELESQQGLEELGHSPQDTEWKYSKQDIENLGGHNARRPDARSSKP